MSKRRRVMVACFALLSLTLVIARTRSSGNNVECEIGPHKVPIRWITYGDAHAKSIIDINLPLIGEVRYPRAALPASDDDGRYIAGYLVVSKAKAYIQDPPGQEIGIRGWSFPQSVIPIMYASAEDNRIGYLKAGDELITFSRPYDGTKLPARLTGATFTAGPYDFKCQVRDDLSGDVYIEAQMKGPKFDSLKFDYQTPAGSGGTASGVLPLITFPAYTLPSGEIHLTGILIVTAKGKSTKYQLDKKIAPKPELKMPY